MPRGSPIPTPKSVKDRELFFLSYAVQREVTKRLHHCEKILRPWVRTQVIGELLMLKDSTK